MRKYVSLLLFFSFIIMLISGIVLYVVPHGRVANWIGWNFLGLDKDTWGAVHTIFGFFMVVIALFHVYFNWRSIKAYFIKKTGFFLSREALVSLGIIILVLAGTIYNVPPFKTIIDAGENIKNMWAKNYVKPPVPHTELFSIKKLALFLGLNPEEVVKFLKKKGLKIKSQEETLKEIGKENGVSPMEIYKWLKDYTNFSEKSFYKKENSEKSLSSESGTGGGWGRLTIRQVCSMFKISQEKCLNILNKEGIKANLDEKLKDVAERYNKRPVELYQIFQKERIKNF